MIKKIMGQNFRVFDAGTVVQGETSCQVTIQGNMEDESNKDTASGYAKEAMTSKQWSAQTESNDVTLASLRAYITAFNSDTKRTIGWDVATDGNATAANASLARSGQAILNDFSLQANNRQLCRLTLQFQGSGQLS